MITDDVRAANEAITTTADLKALSAAPASATSLTGLVLELAAVRKHEALNRGWRV